MKLFKKILLAIIAVFILGGSAAAFAWWDKLTVNTGEENIVTIGEGVELVVLPVVIDPTTAGNLIPASAILKAGDTYSVTLTYTVNFAVAIEEELNFNVTVDNIMVDTVANPYGLIVVDINCPTVIQNDDVTVTLTVTIDDSTLDPINYEDAYLKLANKNISFDVHFAATR